MVIYVGGMLTNEDAEFDLTLDTGCVEEVDLDVQVWMIHVFGDLGKDGNRF